MRNLFLRAHELRHGRNDNPLGSGWEDTLTDAMAFFLASDEQALSRWIRLLLGERAEPVVAIETQWVDGSERPDLAFVLESGTLLLVENKTGAALQERQLERYLSLTGPNGKHALVAFVAMRDRTVPDEVLSNERYLRPAHAEHYRWQDVYACIPDGAPAYGQPWLRTAMRDYLGQLGLAPSSLDGQWDRLYEDRTVPENRSVQQEFGRKLAGVRTHLRRLGLNVTGVTHMGLHASLPGSTDLLYLTVLPARPKREHGAWPRAVVVDNEVLRIALNWDSHVDDAVADRVFRRVDAPFRTSNGHEWWPTRPYRYSQKRIRLDLVTNLGALLADDREVQSRLTVACNELIDHLAELAPALRCASVAE